MELPLPFLLSAGFWGEDSGHVLYNPSLLETDILAVDSKMLTFFSFCFLNTICIWFLGD